MSNRNYSERVRTQNKIRKLKKHLNRRGKRDVHGVVTRPMARDWVAKRALAALGVK